MVGDGFCNDCWSAKISCEKMSEAKQKSFSLMVHQQIVRDYMNVYSPYRGLLLYHGLGAGKTCASIGIAEGLKDVKQVIIMTPASLRMNYVSELKHCGDPIYKINQFWEKIQTSGNPHIEKALSEVLNIPIPYIRKKGFAWMIDVTKPSNFKDLQPEDQKSIDSQINEMIMKKYNIKNVLVTMMKVSMSRKVLLKLLEKIILNIIPLQFCIGQMLNQEL